MTEEILRIENLHAGYNAGKKAVQALRGIDLAVNKGEIFGLLGPNGAGKTTLLSCLECIHTPAQGRIWVDGLDTRQHAARIKSKLGIQLQRTALLDDLTVEELVKVYASLYEVFLTRAQVEALLRQFDLLEQRSAFARRLSGGQAQRLALALAVANCAGLVLLDEPTAALDPHARRMVWNLIRHMHQEGRTVIITTHSMEEAETLCGRVAIMDEGRIIACDTPARLVSGLKAHPRLKTSLDISSETARALPGVCSVQYTGQYLEIETCQPQETLAALQKAAAQAGRTLGDITLRHPTLEDVFISLTGKHLTA